MAQQTTWPAVGRVAVVTSTATALLLGASGCGSSAPSTAPSPSATRPASPASPASPAPVTSLSPTPSHATPSSQSAPSSAAALAVIYGCDRQPVGRPGEFVLFCADAGEILQNLTWSDWGGPTATATGQLREKTCTPNCAAGGTASYPATVTVSGLTGGRYTAMHISAPNAPNPSSDVRLGLDGPTVEPSR